MKSKNKIYLYILVISIVSFLLFGLSSKLDEASIVVVLLYILPAVNLLSYYFVLKHFKQKQAIVHAAGIYLIALLLIFVELIPLNLFLSGWFDSDIVAFVFLFFAYVINTMLAVRVLIK